MCVAVWSNAILVLARLCLCALAITGHLSWSSACGRGGEIKKLRHVAGVSLPYFASSNTSMALSGISAEIVLPSGPSLVISFRSFARRIPQGLTVPYLNHAEKRPIATTVALIMMRRMGFFIHINYLVSVGMS